MKHLHAHHGCPVLRQQQVIIRKVHIVLGHHQGTDALPYPIYRHNGSILAVELALGIFLPEGAGAALRTDIGSTLTYPLQPVHIVLRELARHHHVIHHHIALKIIQEGTAVNHAAGVHYINIGIYHIA